MDRWLVDVTVKFSKNTYYRAVAITSRKHVTKHFRVAKKYCAQWQLTEVGV